MFAVVSLALHLLTHAPQLLALFVKPHTRSIDTIKESSEVVLVVLKQHMRERVDAVHGCNQNGRWTNESNAEQRLEPARLAASARDHTRFGPNTMARLE
jgi:hypothetical protein